MCQLAAPLHAATITTHAPYQAGSANIHSPVLQQQLLRSGPSSHQHVRQQLRRSSRALCSPPSSSQHHLRCLRPSHQRQAAPHGLLKGRLQLHTLPQRLGCQQRVAASTAGDFCALRTALMLWLEQLCCVVGQGLQRAGQQGAAPDVVVVSLPELICRRGV